MGPQEETMGLVRRVHGRLLQLLEREARSAAYEGAGMMTVVAALTLAMGRIQPARLVEIADRAVSPHRFCDPNEIEI